MPSTSEDIALAYKIPEDWAEALVDVSNELGLYDPAMLANVIWYESRFDPANENKDTGATGIIQFIPPTARALGTTTQAIKKMDFHTQMWLAFRHLRPYMRKIRRPEDLYMAVFYPSAIGKPNFVFPKKVQDDNNGIRTPREYTARADRDAKLPYDPAFSGPGFQPSLPMGPYVKHAMLRDPQFWVTAVGLSLIVLYSGIGAAAASRVYQLRPSR